MDPMTMKTRMVRSAMLVSDPETAKNCGPAVMISNTVLGAEIKIKTGAVMADRLHGGTDATAANVNAAKSKSKRKSKGSAKGIGIRGDYRMALLCRENRPHWNTMRPVRDLER